MVTTPNQGTALLREADELNGEDVVPGFHCRVSELFAVPVAGTTE
jgi:hypothetical protein